MAGTRRRHKVVTRSLREKPAKLLLVVALIAGVFGGVAGCAPKSPTNGGGGGNGQIGGAPSGSSTPSPGATTPTAASTTAGITFPSDAKSYTSELLKAWGTKDYNRIGLLATQSAVQQIKDTSNGIGGYPNSQWTYIRCAPGETSGTTDCTWRNVNGDESVVRVTDLQLGHPTAVTQANLDRTQYPGDAASYVGTFLAAWQTGNQQRMARLSSTNIKNYFVGQGTAIQSYTTAAFGIDGTYDRVMVSGLGGDLGRSYEFKVLKSPGGKANAIKAGCTTGCAA
ncbi:MAG: hypothetical protein ACM30G_21065 [Micromonosporaceae bacterium]